MWRLFYGLFCCNGYGLICCTPVLFVASVICVVQESPHFWAKLWRQLYRYSQRKTVPIAVPWRRIQNSKWRRLEVAMGGRTSHRKTARWRRRRPRKRGGRRRMRVAGGGSSLPRAGARMALRFNQMISYALSSSIPLPLLAAFLPFSFLLFCVCAWLELVNLT